MRDPIVEFMNYNRPFAQRNPELLRLKVARMAESAFAFFRGTFHLYARDVLDRVSETLPMLLTGGTEVDLVGDIHTENYGTYKAADEVIHYDINDFDETTHGQFGFDVCRLATSLFLAARERGDTLDQAVLVTLAGVTTYADAVRRLLKKGSPPDFDVSSTAASSCPPIQEQLQAAAAAKRTEFINRLTEHDHGPRRLKRSLHYFNLPDTERQQALRLLGDYSKRIPPPHVSNFYEVQDVCGRVSGIGSMGRLRYVVLVSGKGDKDARNVLLEFKESRPSAYDIYRQRDTDAAALVSRAERVIAVQRYSQIACSPYLGFAVDGPMSFQAREIGPHDSRVDFKSLKPSVRLDCLAQVMATILARAHARAVARAVGLSNPLSGLSDPDVFCQRVLSFALAYADLVRRDWTRFVGARADLENCEQWARATD
jgi:uncharacterized protein (DUF2252 family)